MEVKELRIGNIVYGKLLKKPIKLSVNNLLAMVNGSKLYEPIVLTEEILLKCGFCKADLADMGIYVGLKISEEINVNFFKLTIWIGEHDTNIKTFHGLQNLLFSLTGKELEVNL